MTDGHHALSSVSPDHLIDRRAHSFDSARRRFLEIHGPIVVYDKLHLDEAIINVYLIADRLCRLNGAPEWTRVNGGRLSAPDALGQSCGLLAAE